MEQCDGGAFGEIADTEGLYVYMSAKFSLAVRNAREMGSGQEAGGKAGQEGIGMGGRSGLINAKEAGWTEKIFSADCTSWDKK